MWLCICADDLDLDRRRRGRELDYNNQLVDGSNQDGMRGVLDLTGCASAIGIDAGRVYLGTINGNRITWGCEGKLLLPLATIASVRTPQFWIGDSSAAGNTPPTSLLELGSNTVLNVDNLAAGRRKSKGTVRFASGVSGGVVTLRGDTQAEADLHLGYNDANGTGTGAVGSMDLRGGTLHATLDELALGRHNSGNGNGKGSLYFGSGTVTVNNVVMSRTDIAGSSANDRNTTGWLEMDGGVLTVADSVSDGNGFSSVMVDGGDMVVSNAFNTDDFRVGHNGGAGTIDVDGPVRLGSGSGKGTFIMGPGEVTANDIILGNPNAAAASTNPQNTHGNLLVRDGVVSVQGAVRDAGGTSRIEVTGGELSVRGDFTADTVDLGVAGGTNALLVLNGVSPGQTWQVGALEHETTGTLQFNVGGSMPVLRATDAAFSPGSRLAMGDVDAGGPNTNLAEATAWVGGSNTWDDVTDALWSAGVPAAHVIVASNETFTLIVATNMLTDNGLTCVSTGWTINVTPGAHGTVDVVRVGGPLGTGQRHARISDTNAFVTRAGGLLVGDTPGSGAAASGLSVGGGTLRVEGGLLSDGGRTAVSIDDGDVQIGGDFEATLAMNGGALRVGGDVRRDGRSRRLRDDVRLMADGLWHGQQ